MIKIIAGGKKSAGWVAEACAEYEKRLRKPFALDWQFVDESKMDDVAGRIDQRDRVILLDERGEIWDSPALERKMSEGLAMSKKIIFVIGGADGFGEAMRARADFSWSLSRLVFPHQICRLLVAEQIYRAQEIHLGHPYNHG